MFSRSPQEIKLREKNIKKGKNEEEIKRTKSNSFISSECGMWNVQCSVFGAHQKKLLFTSEFPHIPFKYDFSEHSMMP